MEREATIEKIKAGLLQSEDLGHFVRFETQSFETDVFSKESFFEQADVLFQGYGLERLPSRFIDAEQARKIVAYIVQRNLAHVDTFLTEVQAAEISKLVCSLISPSVHYLTNGLFIEDPFRLSSWNPCTKSTFDTGIIGFDERFVFVIWAQAED